MRRRTYVLHVLEVLVPILFLVAFFGSRFNQLPAWSRDVYPFVLWSLLALTVVLTFIYLVDARRTGQETPFALWSLLVMAIAFVIFQFVGPRVVGTPAAFLLVPLIALVSVLMIVTFWNYWPR